MIFQALRKVQKDISKQSLSYPIDWDVDKFNAFERNLEEINRRIYTQDFGASQTFYPNPVYVLKCRICGAEKVVYARNFENIKNFHCTKHYTPKIKYDESYIGRKKNFLTVVGITRLPNNHRAFICECDCGNITTIEPTMWEKEIVKSCGCKRGELLSIRSSTHGHSGDRLYRVWSSMKSRCYNSKNSNYPNYGGRGISICEEWIENFENFYKWAIDAGYNYNAEFGVCTLDLV